MVRFGEFHIAIDCGPDFRQQMLNDEVKQLDAILITHEHNDHIIGLDDVRPFNFSQRQDMPVYCLPRVKKELENRFAYIFNLQNKYPGAPGVELIEIDEKKPIYFNDYPVLPVPVMHGNLPILGYRFGPITYLTDVRTLSEQARAVIKGSKVLIISALHHQLHHSHLNLEQALELIEALDPERAYLTHISHRMGLHENVSAGLPGSVSLAYDGLKIKEAW
jgi:phosphoribosyl 1,2-cyclic phosphate phosphodiesterase